MGYSSFRLDMLLGIFDLNVKQLDHTREIV